MQIPMADTVVNIIEVVIQGIFQRMNDFIEKMMLTKSYWQIFEIEGNKVQGIEELVFTAFKHHEQVVRLMNGTD